MVRTNGFVSNYILLTGFYLPEVLDMSMCPSSTVNTYQ